MNWFKQSLPDCDDLFVRFFARWYDADCLSLRGFPATFSDVVQYDSLVGQTQAEASLVAAEVQTDIVAQIDSMLDAASGDWPTYLKVSGDVDLAWVFEFDRYYTRARIKDTIERSKPEDFGNDYIVICCEFGAVLAKVLMSLRPGLVWRLDVPYWDSTLLDPETGTAIAVFHWAIKKMSEYGVDDGYAAKVKQCEQLLGENGRLK